LACVIVGCDNCGKKNRVPASAAGTPQCANCHTPLAWITDAHDSDFGDVADQSRMPVLVDLWAPWCGPCRMVSPALEKLAHEFAGRVKLVKVNVDEAPELSRRFEAQSIPTLLLLDHGRTVARQIGAVPESALRKWLEQGLAQTGQTTG
jgi:thioredoxin 2